MPTIPAAIRTRALQQPAGSGRHTLTPTVLGLLIPIFVVFVVGPFLLVYYIRKSKRREDLVQTPLARVQPKVKLPLRLREDARRDLLSVSDIVQEKDVWRMEIDELKESATRAQKVYTQKILDGASVPDRDCAICLATLHAPAPPQPAKCVERTSVDTNCPVPVLTAGDKVGETEEILRLRICTHEFHAECLTSWFALNKYSCPICRAVYWENPSEKNKTNTDSGTADMTREEGSTDVSNHSGTVDTSEEGSTASVQVQRTASSDQPSTDSSSSRPRGLDVVFWRLG